MSDLDYLYGADPNMPLSAPMSDYFNIITDCVNWCIENHIDYYVSADQRFYFKTKSDQMWFKLRWS